MSKRSRFFLFFCLLFFIFFSVFLFFYVGNYFYDFALKSHTTWTSGIVKRFNPNIPVHEQEKNKNKTDDELKAIKNKQEEAYNLQQKEYQDAMNFFSTVGVRDMFITSFDGLRLYAIKILNNVKDDKVKDVDDNNKINHKWCIIIHGYNNKCLDFLQQAKHFYDMGFNLLLVDLRGHGYSQGNYIGMGWHDRIDIKQWINKLIDIDQKAEIVLYGVSMGASTVMMTAGEDLPDNVKLGIEDCGYTSCYDIFLEQLENMFGLGKFLSRLIMIPFNVVSRIRAGFWITEASALKKLKKAKIPILFIHGDSDTYVPLKMLNINYNAYCGNSENKKKIVIKDSPHAMNNFVDPAYYWSSVKTFINKYINLDSDVK